MRTVNVQLDREQLSTMRLALIGWGVRCQGEAEHMEKLAIEMPHLAEKCRANAEASRQFKAEAEAVLAALP